MKLHTLLKSAFVAAFAAGFLGCTADIKDQSAAEIQQQITVSSSANSSQCILSAPQLTGAEISRVVLRP